jgi:hypothetical protein
VLLDYIDRFAMHVFWEIKICSLTFICPCTQRVSYISVGCCLADVLVIVCIVERGDISDANYSLKPSFTCSTRCGLWHPGIGRTCWSSDSDSDSSEPSDDELEG